MAEKIILITLTIAAGVGVYALFQSNAKEYNSTLVAVPTTVAEPILPKKIRPGLEGPGAPDSKRDPIWSDPNFATGKTGEELLDAYNRDIQKYGRFH